MNVISLRLFFNTLFLSFCIFLNTVHGTVSWSTPTAISTLAVNASDPQVVIDSYRNATAAWIENDIVKISNHPFSGSWSEPLSLSSPLAISSSPMLGIDSNGDVTALWIEDTCVKSTVIPRVENSIGQMIYQFLGVPSTANALSSEISTLSGTGATNAVLSVDASGNAVALWMRNSFIESSTRISDEWSVASVRSAVNSTHPDVAVNNNGKAIAAWSTIINGSDSIVTSILTINGNNWSANKNVFNAVAASFHDYPKVAMDANGNSSIIWFRYNRLNTNTYLNVRTLGSFLTTNSPNWSIPVLISKMGFRNPAELISKIGLDSNGNALAVWTNSYDGETFLFESSRKLSGRDWPQSIITQTPGLYSFSFDLSFAAGMALITTMSWDGASSLYIQSQEMSLNPIQQNWSTVTPFSTGSKNGYPKCAVSLVENTINAVSVWINNDGSNREIHASIGFANLISPPSNVSAVQNSKNLHVYKEYYNTISWGASSETDIMQYNIYRNGIFFASTPPNILHLIDNNAVENGTVTYGIAAITSEYVQSPIVSFTLFP